MTQPIFSNSIISAIYCGIGFVFLIGGALWVKQVQLEWMAIGGTALFLILSLYYLTKEYNKEYAKINQL